MSAEGLFRRAEALRRAGAHRQAEALLRHVLALDPGNPTALVALGLTLAADGRPDEAKSAFRKAVRADRGNWRALCNLTAVLIGQKQFASAEQPARQAARLAPGEAEVQNNLALVLMHLGAWEAALEAGRRAVAIDPDLPTARYNLAHLELASGNLGRGWALYESRWLTRDFEGQHRPFRQPPWDGKPLASGSLLVWAEQGVGDEIMFAGLLPELVALGVHPVLECTPRHVPLFSRSFPGIEVLARATPPQPRLARDDIGFQVPMGSLPRWLRPTPESFSGQRSYLRADPERVAALRARYDIGEPLVGLSWRSGNRHTGAQRTALLDHWRPLFELRGIRWISLQYGDCEHEVSATRRATGADILVDPGVDPLADLDAFAAQVAAMDLVVSVDNSTVHYAGALGVPVWTLLSSAPEWRWLRDAHASPWYPGMRLFRQPGPGNWKAVFADVRRELAGWIGAHRGHGSPRYPRPDPTD